MKPRYNQILLTILIILVIIAVNGCVKKPSIENNNEKPSITNLPEEKIQSGCLYNNPSCNLNQECMNNKCVLKEGCQFNNPQCNLDYTCVNNKCIQKSGCAYDSPSCSDDYDCIDNRCVTKKGCAYNNPFCDSENEICIANECTPLVHLRVEDKNCNNDEVYLNGQCEKAAITIVFVPNAISDESYFNKEIEKSLTVFISQTSLKECPQKVRVKTIFPFCCKGKDLGDCIHEEVPEYDDAALLHPLNVFDPNCDVISGKTKSGTPSVVIAAIDKTLNNYGGLAHEFGHTYGLWDQYCYWPSEQNPNPVDFKTGNCRVPESDWFKNMCSHSPDGKVVTPYMCDGDLNAKGGIGIMGLSEHYTRPRYGFTKKDLDYLSEKMKCN